MRYTNDFGNSVYGLSNLLDGFSLNYTSAFTPASASSITLPTPLGWGWSLASGWYLFASLVVTTSGSVQTMQYNDGTGSFELWTNTSNAGWIANFPDNYTVVTTVSNGYTLTFPNQTVLTFNSSGLLQTAVDRNSNTLSYTYTGSVLSSVTDGQGHYYHLTYTNGLLATVYRNQSPTATNSNGTLSLTYYLTGPAANYLETVTDAAGNVYTLSYMTTNSTILLQSVLNPDETTTPVTFTYYPANSTNGSLNYSGFVETESQNSSSSVSAQRVITYSYAPSTDSQGNPTTVMTIMDEDTTTSPPVSRTNTNTFNQWNLLIESVDGLGNQWVNEYNDLSPYLVTTSVDPNLNPTTNVYNGNGQLLSTTDPQGNTTSLLYANYSTDSLLYDLVSTVIQPTISANKVTTNYVTQLYYDARGNLIQVQDPLGNTTFYRVNNLGWLTSTQDANGNTTNLTYTTNNTATGGTINGGNLRSITSPILGSSPAVSFTTTLVYDLNDNPISSTDSLGNTSRTQFDLNHKPTSQTDPLGNVTQLLYSWLLQSITVPSNQASAPNTRSISLGYDVAKRVNAISQQYSSSSSAQRVGYTYSGWGTLKQLSRPKAGSNYVFGYDILDRLTSSEDPMTQTTTITPSPYCNETTVNTPTGIQRVTTNDSLCRLVQATTQSENQSLTYDTLSRLMSVTTGSLFAVAGSPDNAVFGGAAFPSTRSFAYDAGSRLLQSTFPDGKSVFYSFDKVGNLINQLDVFGNLTSYVLLNDYRLSQVVYKNPSESTQTFGYVYTANRLSQIQYPSGTNVSANYLADKTGRLSSLQYLQNVSGTLTNVQGFQYEYDNSSNITAINDTTATAAAVAWTYGYDWFDRLTSVSKSGTQVSLYAFDGGSTYVTNDNRVSFTQTVGSTVNTYSYAFNLADQIMSRSLQVNGGSTSPFESYVTDNDGRMTSRTLNSNNQVTTYGWTGFDKLNELQLNGVVEELDVYSPDGLRSQRNDGTKYYTSRGIPIADARTTGNISLLQADRLRGIDSGGQVYFYLTDHLGSVRATINSSGVVQTTSVYDEFGNVTSTTAPGTFTDKSLAFIGGLSVRNEPNEAGVLLSLMGQRWYDPSLGQFLTRDPIGFNGGLNLYGYVDQNPTNSFDPMGLDTVYVKYENVWHTGFQHATLIVQSDNGIVTKFYGNPSVKTYFSDNTFTQILQDQLITGIFTGQIGRLASGQQLGYIKGQSEAGNIHDTDGLIPIYCQKNKNLVRIFNDATDYFNEERHGYTIASFDGSHTSNTYAESLLALIGRNIPAAGGWGAPGAGGYYPLPGLKFRLKN